jgi:hypothetical protein
MSEIKIGNKFLTYTFPDDESSTSISLELIKKVEKDSYDGKWRIHIYTKDSEYPTTLYSLNKDEINLVYLNLIKKLNG